MSNDTEWGPWIGWNGVECPVDGGAVVQYVWHGSNGVVVEEDFAYNIGWCDVDNKYFMSSYRVKKEPVIEVDSRAVTFSLRETAFIDYANCTYRDGKLISINWEAPDA